MPSMEQGGRTRRRQGGWGETGAGAQSSVLARAMLVLAVVLTPVVASGPVSAGQSERDEALAPRVHSVASISEVELGQPFSWRISVEHAASQTIDLAPELDLRPFEEIRRTLTTRQGQDGRRIADYELVVVGWQMGYWDLPAVEIPYRAGGVVYTVATQPVPLRVTSVIGNQEARLRDIEPVVAVEAVDWILVGLLATAAALAVAVLLLALAMAWVRRRSDTEPAVAAVTLSAHREALARLDRLEASGALDREDRKNVYVELSEILRAYLGRRFDFPALDLTTSEVCARLGSMGEAAHARELLGDWFERADLVKYANYKASCEEARDSLYQVRKVVERTRHATVADHADPSAPLAPDGDNHLRGRLGEGA